MSKCSDDGHVCSGHSTSSSVHQTLDELDFERGIWTAALNGDLLDVKKHLERNTDSDVRDSSGYTALHYASRNGHRDICELLLQRGANPNAITNSGGVTSLHRASYKGHEDIVKLLLKHGADPKKQDSDGKTALHKAVEGRQCHIVRYFVSNYPECITIKDNKGQLPADCVSSHDGDILTLLSGQG